MNELNKIVAQLVMKTPDGTSILSDTVSGPGGGDVSPERAAEIRKELEQRGFEVLEGNLNTLSIAGSTELLAQNFGLAGNAPDHGVAAHAVKVAPELETYVADVFIPPAPTMFR